MRVAVDAMGGDHAPRVVVEGAVAAARESHVSVTLVGPADRIHAELSRYPDAARLDLHVVESGEAVGMGESPAQTLRRKPRASIKVAVDLVARGEAAALFSAGNTGATVLAATRIRSDQGRGAPGAGRHGADRARCRRAARCRGQCELPAPAPGHLRRDGVGLCARGLRPRGPGGRPLSIGEEESKGNDLTREAHRLLRATSLRFVGNVEARDVYTGAADVVVCDGFTGNVAIKMSEGIVEMVEALLRQEFSAADDGYAGYQRLREAFDHLRRRVDYSEYGGAPLLGVAGACIVGHGRSSVKAVRNAILMAHRFAAEGLVGRIEQELQTLQGTSS